MPAPRDADQSKTPELSEPQAPLPFWKRWLFRSIAVIAASLLAYYVGESIYRISVYRRLVTTGIQPYSYTESPLNKFDEQSGFRYVANAQTRNLQFADDGERLSGMPEDLVVHTNNHGHVSHRDVTYEKRPGEYRIAVLGDSFTACLEMARPWPDLVEDRLNEDDELKQALEKSHFRVLNFGRDGTGVFQFAEIHQHEASKFDADLVLFSFIYNDIWRNFVYRKVLERDLGDFKYHVAVHTTSLPCSFENPSAVFGSISLPLEDFSDEDKARRIRLDLARLTTQKINWFSPFPELFASRLGHHFGLHARLFEGYDDYYSSNSVMLERFENACQRVEISSREAIFLWLPVYRSEIKGDIPMYLDDLVDLTYLYTYLPEDVTDDEIDRWFIPIDGHLNQYGGEIYAEAVHKMLKDRLTPRDDAN